MSIVYRQELGRELTWSEADNNFAELKAGVDSKKSNFDILPVTQGGTGQETVDAVKVAFDIATKTELASSAAGKGAELVEYQGATVEAALNERLPEIGTYALLRAYTGPVTSFLVRGVANIFDGGAGVFRVDASDTTTADNGGTVIVDANGRRWKRDFSVALQTKWFGAKGDGIANDTSALQAAISQLNSGNVKKLVINYGVSGIYKTTASLTISVGGVTIEWENSSVTIKKHFNGNVFTVNAGFVTFENPGIDGNGSSGFTGGGIYFADASYFTYDCVIRNPNIRNTIDSCLLFQGPRGGAGISVEGGTLMTYNDTGNEYGGYPSIRLVGPQDGDVSNRTFSGVTSSAQKLIDVTGMWCTKISDCFTGTILFKGNPDVTGLPIVAAPYSTQCAEVLINNTYVRGGLRISGGEVIVDNSITHGYAPIFSVYGGGATSFETTSWTVESDTVGCYVGPNNSLTHGIANRSQNGLAFGIQNSVFAEQPALYSPALTNTTTNPTIGNGSIVAGYTTEGKYINVTIKIVAGTDTNFGTGSQVSMSLPLWTAINFPAVGTWHMYIAGVGWKTGMAFISDTGSTHRISLVDSSGAYISGTNPASFPQYSSLVVNLRYLRG